ncbi:adenosine deaminase-like protein [Hymenopellis radicata]|nr:adenosine deaminase-like protein [Hymenopellis radicata]
MSNKISGPSLAALNSLSPSQISFLQSLPKAELHAHLNGSIPLQVLYELASEAGVTLPDVHTELNVIADFFNLFPAIYALTNTPPALARIARAVLTEFLDGPEPQCSYLELRSTPKATDTMSRRDYVKAVLDEIEKYPADQAAMIVSLDRKMDEDIARECVQVAIDLKREGRRVVGVDLCGDPWAGDVDVFCRLFKEAKENGLSVTLHIAETSSNPSSETLKFLSIPPDRLGHATFLDADAQSITMEKNIPIEICLSSNLLCKTVESLDAHHIAAYLKSGHPIAICTDDILPFRNSLLSEYALLMAPQPLGLGLSEDEIRKVADMSMKSRFVQ